MAHVLAVDVGTTGVKGLLVTSDGVVVADALVPTSLSSPRPGWAEADPESWWQAFSQISNGLLSDAAVAKGDVAVVSVSGMVPTLIALDESHRPLRPSIQQNDGRAGEEIAALAAAMPNALQETGAAVTAQSIGPKWQWLCRHEPDVAAATRHITGSYGWITGRLTGEWVAESNWALESGLATLHDNWHTRALELVGLDADQLGPIVRSPQIVGQVTGTAASVTGLAAGTPVVAGCADHVASACSAGLRKPGQFLLKLGGAADILAVTPNPVVDSRIYLDRHPFEEAWLPNGCMASSGSLLRWFQREVAGGAPLQDLDAEANLVEPTGDGLVVLPYFLGEKSPLNDPRLRGAIVGMHLGHTTAHLYRAVLESIAFGFAHHLEVFAELGVVPLATRITNGGSRSSLWRRIVADVCGIELESLVVSHGSAMGAAAVGIEATGLATAASFIDNVIEVDTVISPDPLVHSRYREHYRRYRSLLSSITPNLHNLADIQTGTAAT